MRNPFVFWSVASMLALTGCGGVSGTPAGAPGGSHAVPTASQTSLTFAGGSNSGTAAQIVTVTETGYGGLFTVNQTACTTGAIANVTPQNGAGPSAQFSVSPENGGTCTLLISDVYKQSVSVNVSVTDDELVVQ